jgi:hypothetical protein
MKRLLMAILFFMLPFYLFAQFSVGIKTVAIPFFNANRPFGNLQMENIEFSDMGFFPIINAGMFAHYSFNDSLALQAEAKYTIEGFYYQINTMIEDEFYGSVALGYIEIPLLLQYKRGINFNWFIQSGFSIKWLIVSECYTVIGEETFPEYTNTITEKLNNLVFKANIGSGFMYNFSQYFMFTGEMRWGYDITPIIGDVHFLKMDVAFGIAYKFK